MTTFRRAVIAVALLNFSYGVVEFVVARAVGSVSLMADSVDFFEDAMINGLVFVAAVWSVSRRARIGHVLAVIIFVPAAVTLVTAILKILDPARPDTVAVTATGIGALAINLICAVILVRVRSSGGSLATAAWLAARNDAVANLAVIAAAMVALVWVSGWPDIIVGLAIGLLNADAGVKVWRAASAERWAAGQARS